MAMEEREEYNDGAGANGEEEVAQSKKRARINAIILGVIVLLVTLAPPPWRSYAPLLFLIPLVYSVMVRVRRQSTSSIDTQETLSRMSFESPREDPYSHTPRDPKDPRRYKPIG